MGKIISLRDTSLLWLPSTYSKFTHEDVLLAGVPVQVAEEREVLLLLDALDELELLGVPSSGCRWWGAAVWWG